MSQVLVLRRGEKVAGYTLEERLGSGNYGEVWRASAGGALAALKFIGLGDRAGYREWSGVRRVRRIQHKNLMPITGIWMLDEDGEILSDELVDRYDREQDAVGDTLSPEQFRHRPAILVVAMLLADMNLSQRAEQCRQEGIGPGIPVDELLEYMKQAAEGLDFLSAKQHDLGGGPQSIQHLDIKPENILLRGGSVLICDFGLAQTLGDVDLTVTSKLGTLAYISPECLEQRPSLWSDQYSLACSYYKLRTGEWPFDEDTSEVRLMNAHLNGELDISALPPPERKVIRKAISVEPTHRFRSSLEMVAALEEAVRQQRAGRAERRRHRSRMWQTAGALAAVALVVLAWAWTARPWEGRDNGSTPASATPQPTYSETERLIESGQYQAAFDRVAGAPASRKQKTVAAIIQHWATRLGEKNRNSFLASLRRLQPILASCADRTTERVYGKAIEKWLTDNPPPDTTARIELLNEIVDAVPPKAAIHHTLAEQRDKLLEQIDRQAAKLLGDNRVDEARAQWKLLDRFGPSWRLRALFGRALAEVCTQDWPAFAKTLEALESQRQAAEVSFTAADEARFRLLRAMNQWHGGSQERFSDVLGEVHELAEQHAPDQAFREWPLLRAHYDSLCDALLNEGIGRLERGAGLAEADRQKLNDLSGGLLELERKRLQAEKLLEQGAGDAAALAEVRTLLQQIAAALAKQLRGRESSEGNVSERAEVLRQRVRLLEVRAALADASRSAAEAFATLEAWCREPAAKRRVKLDAALAGLIDRFARELVGEARAEPLLDGSGVLNVLDAAQARGELPEADKARVAQLRLVQSLLAENLDYRALERACDAAAPAGAPGTLLDALVLLARWECQLARAGQASSDQTLDMASLKPALDRLSRHLAATAGSRLNGYRDFLEGLARARAVKSASVALDERIQVRVEAATRIAAAVGAGRNGQTPTIFHSRQRRTLAARILLEAVDVLAEAAPRRLGTSPFYGPEGADQALVLLAAYEQLAAPASEKEQGEASVYQALASYYHTEHTEARVRDAIERSEKLLAGEPGTAYLPDLLLVHARAHKECFDQQPAAVDHRDRALTSFAQLIGKLRTARSREAYGLSDRDYYENVLSPSLELAGHVLGTARDAEDDPAARLAASAGQIPQPPAADTRICDEIASICAATAELLASSSDPKLTQQWTNATATAQSLFVVASKLVPQNVDYRVREAELYIRLLDPDMVDKVRHAIEVAESVLKNDASHAGANALLGWATLQQGAYCRETFNRREYFQKAIDYYAKAVNRESSYRDFDKVGLSNAYLLLALTYRAEDPQRLRENLFVARELAQEATASSIFSIRIHATIQLGNVLEDISDFGARREAWREAEEAFGQALRMAEEVGQSEGGARLGLGRCLYKRATREPDVPQQVKAERLQRALEILQGGAKKPQTSSQRAQNLSFQSLVLYEQSQDAQNETDRKALLAEMDSLARRAAEVLPPSHVLWATYQLNYIQAAERAENYAEVTRRTRDMLEALRRQVTEGKTDFLPADVCAAVATACAWEKTLAAKLELLQGAIDILEARLRHGSARGTVCPERGYSSLIELYEQRMLAHLGASRPEDWQQYARSGWEADLGRAREIARQMRPPYDTYKLGEIEGFYGTAYAKMCLLDALRGDESKAALGAKAIAAFEKAIKLSAPWDLQVVRWKLYAGNVHRELASEDPAGPETRKAAVKRLLEGVDPALFPRFGSESDFLRTLYKSLTDWVAGS